ncbi:MAG: primosomal protein N' [Elusimicrobia bacterium RIFOXYA2_FULL_58_8]|nr:MAG: primosomal protein N' [Elusimicrobia bacterium RIFOXYA2_FULL_58_8]
MLAEISFPIPLRRTFYYLLPEELELNAAPGLRVLASFGKREAVVGVITRVLPEKDADLTRFKQLKSVIRLLDENPLFPEDALALARWMSGRWGSPLGLCLGAFFEHAPREIPLPGASFPRVPPTAAPDVPQDIKELLAAAGQADPAAFLLRLTALERREVIYQALFGAALKPEDSQGLLLVPDLNFIPAFTAAFETVFPGRVCAWHSRLTPKKRAAAWAGAVDGTHKIVIATRTGVFLPFKNLRFAIMDGEDEEIYKQEEAEPCYHAREVLLKRIKVLNASVLLSSPCPSIEAWGAAAAGGLQRFDAPAAAAGSSPEVRVLDMGKYPGDILARPLADSLRAAVAAGGQALVIAGRKGYASRLFCANCGWMPRCQACGPGMTLLKTAAGGTPSLLCRRCGRKEAKPAACPQCGGKVFRDYGAGTQKTQDALSKLMPGAKIARFDGDIMRGSLKTMRAELDSFSKGTADVLVGTRVALRELGAPRLGLIAFIDADADLSSADFRASEKAYRSFYGAWRLLGKKGELFIQTRESGHYVFSRLAEMDYPSFADGELAARRDFLYPPFSFIVKARFASFDRKAMAAAAADFLRAVSFLGSAGDGSEILGPVIPPGQEKRKFYSEYYLVKAASEKAAMRCMENARAIVPRPGVKYFIEADPYGAC